MRVAAFVAGLLAVLVAAPPAVASTAPKYPTTFSLPDGFQPEGIAVDEGRSAYFGSRATGAIFKVDLRSGTGKVINAGPGTPSLGLKVKRNRLFVAGGTGGNARVLDARTGKLLKTYTLATGTSFVNDVVLTRDAAYFTDSTNPFLYKLDLSRWGRLPAEATRIPLTGDLVYTTGINANGISQTPDGKALLVVQSNTGKLFRVDKKTGVTKQVDLGTELLTNGDGLLLEGRRLIVVQNFLNTVTWVELDRRATKGTIERKVTDPGFDVPTTVAAFKDRLYLPNARFTTTPTPTTTYNVVSIKRH
ncbi:SMP-30/gluconolactonase/LRE family protein [Herbidospora mongoliensis]|uniref:SMP-30/gluconolactonase/LRE family protein n=1 Tax=Herbidospora mongoliensis TaxID=688067 RepID=UPI000832EE5E|nr:SMP-30/gluconolactonase/LRE family protein [Herbidospora mongoliensis]